MSFLKDLEVDQCSGESNEKHGVDSELQTINCQSLACVREIVLILFELSSKDEDTHVKHDDCDCNRAAVNYRGRVNAVTPSLTLLEFVLRLFVKLLDILKRRDTVPTCDSIHYDSFAIV